MKKILSLLALCISNLICASPIQERKIEPEALKTLSQALGIAPDKNIIEESQKHWLRKPGQERWELDELSLEKRQYVLNWAKSQGLFNDWKPSHKTYDKALILGATTSRMQMRLDYLKDLWKQGIRFKEIVWLTGDRPLDKQADSLLDVCKNESEAARYIWQVTDLPLEMRKLTVVYVAVPMKKEGAAFKRPNTEDTLIAWQNRDSSACTALFISDQPFCGYQFAVIKASLPPHVQFDVVGRGVDPSSHPAAAAITLDSIARWIYQENLQGNKL